MDLYESPRSVSSLEEDGHPRKRPPQETTDDCSQRPRKKSLDNFPSVFISQDKYLQDVVNITPKKSSVVRCYSGLSLPGSHNLSTLKVNQDSLLMFEDAETDTLICACLDGHGMNGQKISQIFCSELQKRLLSHPMFAKNIEMAITETLTSIEYEIYRREARLADYSGTTLSLVIIRGSRVTVANIGDSRVVLAKHRRMLHLPTAPHAQPTPVLDAFPLSIDHKPHHPMEQARILAAGGRVFSVRYEDGVVGPPRVWLGRENLPGLAMSRSLGDFVVHTAGVISTPDIFHYELQPDEDSFLVLATDGLWDVLQNQEVVSIVHQSQEAGRAVCNLIHEIRQRLPQNAQALDDTTISIVQFRASTGRECVYRSDDRNGRDSRACSTDSS